MIRTICEVLHCWHAVISHNDVTGPQCLWLLKHHVQIILKKLRCAYFKKVIFGWHLLMRRPPSAWGRVRACLYVSSIRKPRASLNMFVFCCIEILRSLFSVSHHCGCPGVNTTVIFISQKLGADTSVHLASFYECCKRLVVLEVLEMKGKWEGSVLVRPVYFCKPSARGPLCFSVLPQNTWRQMLGSSPRLAPDISTVIQHKVVRRRNQVW